jgi:hypothetical protein
MEPVIRETLVLQSVSCYLCTVYNYPTSGALSQIHSARKIRQPVCQSVCFSVCPPGYLSPACLSVCLFVTQFVCISSVCRLLIFPFVSQPVSFFQSFRNVCVANQSVHLWVCLSVILSACLSEFLPVYMSVAISY